MRMQAKRAWWEYIEWWVFLPVLLFGVLLHYTYPGSWPLSDVITHGLSDALMIAAVLGITVDRIAKDRLLTDVSADIWHQLMGRDLPLEIKHFIKDGLLNTHLVCTRYEIRYHFTDRTDGRLDIEVELRRDLENFSHEKQSEDDVHIGIPLDLEPTFHSVTVEQEGEMAVSRASASPGDGIIMIARYGR